MASGQSPDWQCQDQPGFPAALGAKNGELALLQEQGNPTHNQMLPREPSAPHAGGDAPAGDRRCHTNAGGGTQSRGLPAAQLTPWGLLPSGMVFLPSTDFPSQPQRPRNLRQTKTTKIPNEIPAKSLKSRGWDLEGKPPQCTESRPGAATARNRRCPGCWGDSLKHRAQSRTGTTRTWIPMVEWGGGPWLRCHPSN